MAVSSVKDNAMKCKAYQSEIEEKGPGRESLSQQARAHLAGCAACRAFSDERAALRRLLGDLPAVEAPADFDFRLRARLFAAESEKARAPRAWGFAPGALSLALAASFVMFIGVAVFLRPAARPEMPSLARNQSVPPPALPVERVTPASATGQPGATAINSLDAENRQLEAAEAARAASSAARELLTSAEQRQLARAAERRRNSENIREAGLPVRAFREPAPLLSVPVSHPTQPVQVMMRDEGGASRAVAIESVSFGAQDVAGRLRQPRRAPLTADQGVW